jgi:putative ABC transport system ATP-binding protein
MQIATSPLPSTSRAPVQDDIIQVRGLTRTLPMGAAQVPILRGLSFAIPRRAWVAIMGPSGSGKSTLLGILAGLDVPSSGSVQIAGTDITHMGEGRLARFRNETIGVVFQSFNLVPTLTALENVEVPLHASRQPARSQERAKAMLAMVGLSDRLHHRPNQLSGGQQQRVAIARALVNEPPLLIADEPTGNLDRKTGETVLDLFARLRDELGITMVVATHDGAVAARVDAVLRLVDGQLVEEAS